jgi:hypothetical protein
VRQCAGKNNLRNPADLIVVDHEGVITWHGELIKSYAMQGASEKITRLANETVAML